MLANDNGAVVWEGLSRLDRSAIVLILTGMLSRSLNVKTSADTGAGLLQTWIIPAFELANVAVREGRDVGVCGDCPHRGTASGGSGACYVRTEQAPRAVGACYQRGGYAPLDPADIFGRSIRLGSYGDPAAVPSAVWRELLRDAGGWVGYTHQWRRASARALQRWCMASVDSEAERVAAQAAGWRTFRGVAPAEPLRPDPSEVLCPASAEAGHVTTCDRCMLCHGAGEARSIVIRAHGGQRTSWRAS